MATLRNNRNFADLNKKNYEENPRNNLAQNSRAIKSQKKHTTQVSEEIEGKITDKLSNDFSQMQSCIRGILTKIDEFLLNPLLQGHSGAAPEKSRNTLNINWETNEDNSQGDPHPEARVSQS